MEANVVWLAIVFIVFQAGDGVAAGIPIAYIKDDLDRLNVSPTLQRIIPMIKIAAAAGLLVGLWVPWFGALTCAALVVYFIIALDFHRKASDKVVQYLPAVGVGALSAVVGIICYLSAI